MIPLQRESVLLQPNNNLTHSQAVLQPSRGHGHMVYCPIRQLKDHLNLAEAGLISTAQNFCHYDSLQTLHLKKN